MAKALKRHRQLPLPTVDKNGQRRGGKRKHAGRPARGKRSSERHKVRPTLSGSQPIHVVMRAAPSVGSLRTHGKYRAIREASYAAFIFEEKVSSLNRSDDTAKLGRGFRIVHMSIQRSHIHLIVEASDRMALARGMQGFSISAAKHINSTLRDQNGTRRRGNVFVDRYHTRVLTVPSQVRNCLAYVMNNWRHHREDRERLENPWRIDPYSSALAFDGWKERGGELFRVPRGYIGPMVWWPKTWLLEIGWRKCGLISVYEVPGRGDE